MGNLNNAAVHLAILLDETCSGVANRRCGGCAQMILAITVADGDQPGAWVTGISSTVWKTA